MFICLGTKCRVIFKAKPLQSLSNVLKKCYTTLKQSANNIGIISKPLTSYD